jgi:excisionase family DNA binding protein
MTTIAVREASSSLGVSERTLYRMLEAGDIAGVRVGRQWRIPEDAMRSLAWKDLPPPPGLASVVEAAIASVEADLAQYGFARAYTEADLADQLAAELRRRLPPNSAEVHRELSTAGEFPRDRPDISIIAPMPPFSDRRGSRAYWSAELKWITSKGRLKGVLPDSPVYRPLLNEVQEQFKRLASRKRLGLLGGGAVIAADAFDWRRLVPEGDRVAVVSERARWFRENLTVPGSGIRVLYLPVLFPEHRVDVPNEAESDVRAPRVKGSLRGAAVPFVRRWPDQNEDWSTAADAAASEDWANKNRL